MGLSDTETASAVLKHIALEKKWSQEDVEGDLAILAKNRLVHVQDLRSLSKESWTQIDLLPLVKDLLRAAISPTNGDRKDKEKKDKKKEKKEKKRKEIKNLGAPVVPTILTKTLPLNQDQNTITNDLSLSENDDYYVISPTTGTRRKNVSFSNQETPETSSIGEETKKEKKKKEKRQNP